MAPLDTDRVTAALKQGNPSAFLEAGRIFVDTLSADDRLRLKRALGDDGEMGAALNDLQHGDPSVRCRRDQMVAFLTLAENMPDDVEREGRQVVIADMFDLPGQKVDGSTISRLDLSAKGWPVCPEIIQLNGALSFNGMPALYYAHDGEVHYDVDGHTGTMTNRMQIAVPHSQTCTLKGDGIVYVLRCQPDLGGSFAKGNFDEPTELKPCPCGDSHRLALVNAGWGFSTHRTVMNEMNKKHNGKFHEHQHKRTHEIYFTDEVSGSAQINVDKVPVPIRRGTLIAIPNGTLHAVESEGRIVQHIFVGGGHKDDDFWSEDWEQLKRS